MKVKLFGIGGKNRSVSNERAHEDVVLHRNNESTCKSPSILSLQIFATGPTFLTFNQTHYERNDLIG
jgi:hypothetical protein